MENRMARLREIVNAYSVENVSENYKGDVEITDLKRELGTKGHVLVVRGDKAYEDKLGKDKILANPKFWLYENLINSPKIQEALKKFPEHKLFDGVGFSALEALGYHSKKLGRKAVAVMAHEFVPDSEIFEKYNIEIINAEGPAEEGYVEKQRQILKERKDIIPLHQALYGAQALAPIGNKVTNQLEEMCIKPDASFWCIASGSNLYGIGRKIKEKFSNCETIVVEPETNQTIDKQLDLRDSEQIKVFAKDKLKNYSLKDWNRRVSGIFPLHAKHPNMYLLRLWAHTGNVGFDKVVHIRNNDTLKTQQELKEINPEYYWTKTTALTLNPAIELAKKGQNVVVMAYGKERKNLYRDVTLDIIENNVPWIFR